MIKYRPQRGSLEISMRESKEFADIADMLKHISQNYGQFFSMKEVVICESYGEDDRIGWKSWRHICTKRWGDKNYDVPQCFAFCDLGELG